jgi:tetratricopeptide (TPR) repeat protein
MATSLIRFQESAAGSHGTASRTSPPSRILENAKELIEQGKTGQAESLLMNGLSRFPNDSALHNFLGVVQAQQHHFHAAEESFQKAIQEDPRYASAYLNLGHLYVDRSASDRSMRERAIDTYTRFLRVDPRNQEANYQKALLLLEAGDERGSLDCVRHLEAGARQRPMVLALLLADHADLHDTSQARNDLQALLASPQLSEADVLDILPQLRGHERQMLSAELLEGLASRGLASPVALNQLGVIQEQLGQMGKARKTLEKAAEADPNPTPVLIELARLADKQRDYHGALGYLAHARSLEPQNARIHFFFGMMCVDLDLHQEAYDSLKKAVALDPHNPYYNYALGAVCTERQDANEAIPYFKKYCALKPRDPRGNLALGGAYYYSHDLDSARNELLKVVHDKVTEAAASYYLGRIANDEGQWSHAVQELQAAISNHPGYADAYAALGSSYLNLKDYTDCEKSLRQALRIEPDNYYANLNLMVLYQRIKDPRAAAQTRRFGEVKNEREQRAKLFLRTIRVVP